MSRVDVLRKVDKTGACFVRGAELRHARAMAKIELVTIEDESKRQGRTAGERWWCALTLKGLGALANVDAMRDGDYLTGELTVVPRSSP